MEQSDLLQTDNLVLIVHAVDTEGPLYESTSATFQRLKHLFGLTHLPPTRATIEALRRQEIDLGGIEEKVATVVSGHLIDYNDTWDKIDRMLERLNSPRFRLKTPDSFGRGWVFNWHCLDHVGFVVNPRRRSMGFHAIFDHYAQVLRENPEWRDQIHFHFHPVSTYREAHKCATSFVNSPELHEILCRRIIERNWFPSVFRAGFQAERPDSHWFLEQWIPFDISSMAMEDHSELDAVTDFRNGRSGDWRGAPSDWSLYHPSHDDWRRPGNCRRVIGRALNVLNRIGAINQHEMDKAFARAAGGQPTVVGLASHDFRDLEAEVDFVQDLIRQAQARHPGVKVAYCEAGEAFRRALYPETLSGDAGEAPVELDLSLNPDPENDVPHLTITCRQGRAFGPQPFLAIETMSHRFIHDNLDFSLDDRRWSYAFHDDTLPLDDVRRIGVATNDKYGHTDLKVLELTRGAPSIITQTHEKKDFRQ
ncbi:hypothetical protein [Roseospirillum parvum]|uniref:Uncharacterized protein n=1 Tax=Roseospirillum parvum TaxID=83401 RepID=A0A1G7UZI0_9PROT|nr:hypothetical protein [Roseospirillum parvum]SDG52943.1 hypothetical protein SAMN05421742_101488 [Roseospirillum parvum]